MFSPDETGCFTCMRARRARKGGYHAERVARQDWSFLGCNGLCRFRLGGNGNKNNTAESAIPCVHFSWMTS